MQAARAKVTTKMFTPIFGFNNFAAITFAARALLFDFAVTRIEPALA